MDRDAASSCSHTLPWEGRLVSNPIRKVLPRERVGDSEGHASAWPQSGNNMVAQKRDPPNSLWDLLAATDAIGGWSFRQRHGSFGA